MPVPGWCWWVRLLSFAVWCEAREQVEDKIQSQTNERSPRVCVDGVCGFVGVEVSLLAICCRWCLMSVSDLTSKL